MTKSTGKEKRKYDPLNKSGTTKARKDYIETSYVNGVRDENGNEVIRPLTKEEKEWLTQFISETEHGNLNKTKQIKLEVSERKALRSDWNYAKYKGNVNEMARLEALINEKTKVIEQLRASNNNFYTKEADVTEIYDRDYERRMDVYNNAKITDNLVLFDLSEYDKFTTEAINDVNPENLILKHMEPKERRFRRRKKKIKAE